MKIIYPTGATYEGDVVNEKREGHGIYITENII